MASGTIAHNKIYTKTVGGVSWTVVEETDGLVIMWASLSSMSFACTNSSSGVYYSNFVNIDLPVTISAGGAVFGTGNQVSTVVNAATGTTVVSLRVMTAISRTVQGPNICVIGHK